MSRIDFLISNDRHHTAMFAPVLRLLLERPSYQCQIVSFCEFRGLSTPVERFQEMGVPTRKLSPRFRLSSSSGSQKSGAGARRTRNVARRLSWYLLLARAVEGWLASKPDLVLLGNDSAFPYDRITARLHFHQIPFILVQEGIRFWVPAGDAFERYGKAGAAAIAAWGETSANFFRLQGVAENRIHLTGNPRFDDLVGMNWRKKAEEERVKWGLGHKTLLFLSNPIDDQGFCTTAERVDLIYRFAVEISNLFHDPEFRLFVKLHGRESVSDVSAVLANLPYRSQIIVSNDAPLYPLFCLAQAAIVLASTVGLEALLFGLPLGVLEIPRWDFAFDYVSSGVALGLSWNRPMSNQVVQLMEFGIARDISETYLTSALAHRDGAAKAIAALIEQVVTHRASRTA